MITAQMELSLDATTSVLEDFAPKPRERQNGIGKDKPKPRHATRRALATLAEINTMDELRHAKGYMSAAQYRVFSQCGATRSKGRRPR
jgi:hypothetical protein